jgi:hypothetical protein
MYKKDIINDVDRYINYSIQGYSYIKLMKE